MEENICPLLGSEGTKIESISPEHHHVCRPFCACCGGGETRKGYRYNKSRSHWQNTKSRRSKAKYKSHGR